LIILLKAKDWEFKDKKVWFLIILLFIFNSIGYFTGSLGTLHIINGFVAFIGIITIFFIAQGVLLTEKRIKNFVIAAAILGILNLFVTINSFYQIIDINSPLFVSFYGHGQVSRHIFTNNGTLCTIEIFGEWAMLNSFLLLPFIFLKKENNLLKKKESILIRVGFISSLLCAYLSFSKAVILLTLSGLFLYLIYSIIIFYDHKAIVRYFLVVFLMLIITPIIYDFFDFTYLLGRFYENPDFLKNFLENPLTGEGTSRAVAYQLGLDRISEQNWIFGNGWSIPEGNAFSWFGNYQTMLILDFHNLYFCLIPIWGYTGSFIFVLIILITAWKLSKNIIKLKYIQNSLLLPLMIGMLFVLIFFLIDEYKINATRNSYFSVVMIWLGLAINANSIANNLINE